MDIPQSLCTPPSNYPRTKHRTHGLSAKPSLPQILSYLLIIGEIVIYFVCVFPNYQSIPILVLYCLFGVLMIISTYLSTTHNPTDYIVYYYKWSQNDSKIKFKCNYKEVKFCNFCNSYCNKQSKHCKQCNRCVPEFDHHCMWFNNCVGKSNYKTFFVSIVCTFFHLALFMIHGIVMSIQQNSYIEAKLNQLIVVWIFLLILAIFQFLLLNLIALHIYLTYLGLTTYQFLKQTKASDQKKVTQKQQQNNLVQVNDIIQKQQLIANIANIIRVSSQDTSDSVQIHETREMHQKRHIELKHQEWVNPISKDKIIQEKSQHEINSQDQKSFKKSHKLQNSQQKKNPPSQTVKQNYEYENQAQQYISIQNVRNVLPQVKSQNQQDHDRDPSQKTVKIRNRCRTIITFTNDEEEPAQKTQTNFSSYFKNNRSFKFILNGDSPRAQSPRRQRGQERFTSIKKSTKNKDKQAHEIQLFSFDEPTRQEPNN